MDFLGTHDALAERHSFDALASEERAAARREIEDAITHEIATLFTQQEKRELHLGKLQALHAICLEFQPEKVLPTLSANAAKAFLRARAQGNYSALECLDRELNRMREEEEHALTLLLTH